MDYENCDIKNVMDQEAIDKFFKTNILICCNNCSEMLFTNQEISSFFIKSLEDFYIIVNPVELDCFNVKRHNELTYNNPIIDDKYLGYQLIDCPECESVIGGMILVSSSEKFFLIGKCMISNKEIYAVNVDKPLCHNYDLKQLFNLSRLPNKLDETNKIIKQIEDKYSQLLKDFEDVSDYKTITESLEDSKQFIEKLTTIARINKLI